jgi:predicted lipoprotein with Yx(FWY)xxD motif
MFEAVYLVNGRRGLLAMVTIAALVAVGCGGGSGAGSNSGGNAGTGGYGNGGNNGGPYGGDGGNVGGTLSLASKADLGKYLVSPEGRTLYYFALDVPAGAGQAPVSNCTAGCLSFWPVFHVDAPAVSGDLNASDFGEFARPDGSRQTTFKGWPLYFFAGDTAAGETKGDNLGEPRPTDLWFVIKDPFYAALVVTKNGGPVDYLADPTGRALYVFPGDTTGTATSAPVSACTDAACLSAWPVFSAGAGTLPTGLDPAKLTSFTRADGLKQSAFDGHPLYYFVGDTAPGATSGQGADGFDIAVPSTL